MLKMYDVHKSNPYNIKYSSKNDVVSKLSQDIFDAINIDKVKKRELKLRCVATTILNLKVAYETRHYVRVSRKNEYYSQYPKRYKYPFYTYYIMKPIIDGLADMGKLELLTGFKNFNDNSGQQTKIAPTKEFIEELKAIKRDMFEEVEPPELVILKNREDKFYKDYRDTNKTRKMRRSLVSYNELRQKSRITLKDVNINQLPEEKSLKVNEFLNRYSLKDDYTLKELPLRNPFIYRVFNDTFKLGGRYYGGIESNMPKLLRQSLYIDGEGTVEKDFSSMHIRMLYHSKGIDYKNDAYNAVSNGDPELRKLYKLIGLVTINSTDMHNAINGIRNEIRDIGLNSLFPNLKDESIKPYIDNWVSAHPQISEFLNSDYGIKLQNIDSYIAQDVVDHFRKKSIVVLVVHDSFIVQKKHEDELVQVMNDSYRNKFSFNAIIN